MNQNSLMDCARIVVEKIANIHEGERVLTLTDNNYLAKNFPDLLFENALSCGAESVKLVTTPPKGEFKKGEISSLAKSIMAQAEVILVCTSTAIPSAIKDDIINRGSRIVIMHLLSDNLLMKVIPIDYDLLQKRAKKLAEMMPKTEKAHVTTLKGSDITFSLKGSKFAWIYDGLCHPGEAEGIPAGNMDITPVPGTANGTIVIDGTLSHYGFIKTPIKMTVKKGEITKIEGGPEAKMIDTGIKRALNASDTNANKLSELMFGLNPNAEITYFNNCLIEDDRRLGGINIGWGRNIHLGGIYKGNYHEDGTVRDITLDLDGITLLKNGIPTKELDK